MILLTEKIEEGFKKLLQTNIQVVVRDRRLASGKFLLYRFDGFYIILMFYSETGIPVEVEIPYPFNIIDDDKKLIFDYRLESLSEKDFQLLFNLQSISKKRESKFYNGILEISQV